VIFWDWVIDALLRRPDQAPARRTNDDRGAHFHPTTAFCKNIQKFDSIGVQCCVTRAVNIVSRH
jgi:hypothetical protein